MPYIKKVMLEVENRRCEIIHAKELGYIKLKKRLTQDVAAYSFHHLGETIERIARNLNFPTFLVEMCVKRLHKHGYVTVGRTSRGKTTVTWKNRNEFLA